jgi:hypothetical protein
MWDEEKNMNHRLLLAALALALGSAATAAVAAPAADLSGIRSGDGFKLLHAVRDGYDRDDRSWSYRNRWDDNDHRGHYRWSWHRRHHRDRDYDRWSWGRDRDHGHGYRDR